MITVPISSQCTYFEQQQHCALLVVSDSKVKQVLPFVVCWSTGAPCSSMLWMIPGSPRATAKCSAVSPFEFAIVRSAPANNTHLINPMHLVQEVLLTCLDQQNAHRCWNDVLAYLIYCIIVAH